MLVTGTQHMVAKTRQYESFSQRCLKSVLIEERRRHVHGDAATAHPLQILLPD